MGCGLVFLCMLVCSTRCSCAVFCYALLHTHEPSKVHESLYFVQEHVLGMNYMHAGLDVTSRFLFEKAKGKC